MIQVEQGTVDPVRRTIRVSGQTEFECPADAGPPCDCSAIAVGSRIAVVGTIFPARPGEVQADIVYLQVSSVAVELTGPITQLACESGALAVRDDATERAYTAWPERLYLIDRDGRIAYKSAPGPFGFKPAALEAALTQLVGTR